MILSIKKCNKCFQEKTLDNFKLRVDSNTYRNACISCLKIERQKYHINNKEKDLLNNKLWYQNNKEHYRHTKKLYKNKKYKTDVEYKLLDVCRSRINRALHRNAKSGKSLELLGCSIIELKQHLEKQFKEGMSWYNHGYGDHRWHIDHIIPCASFDLTDPNQQKKCFNYTNLQPLWHKDNIEKGCKILTKSL